MCFRPPISRLNFDSVGFLFQASTMVIMSSKPVAASGNSSPSEQESLAKNIDVPRSKRCGDPEILQTLSDWRAITCPLTRMACAAARLITVAPCNLRGISPTQNPLASAASGIIRVNKHLRMAVLAQLQLATVFVFIETVHTKDYPVEQLLRVMGVVAKLDVTRSCFRRLSVAWRNSLFGSSLGETR